MWIDSCPNVPVDQAAEKILQRGGSLHEPGQAASASRQNRQDSATPASRLDRRTRFCLAWAHGSGFASRVYGWIGGWGSGQHFRGQGNSHDRRAMSLPALVQGSRRILVITPAFAESHFEELGRRRRIVTDTRVRVEEAVAKGEGADRELLVRTLGGSIDKLGELVHGQARLVLGQACVAFLLQGQTAFTT